MTNAPDLKRVPHAVQGYIHDLEERVAGDTKRIGELSQRIEQLEEQVRLLQSERYAPKSEKRQDRMFDEAEQLASEPSDEDAGPGLPDTGLPTIGQPERSKAGRKPLPAYLKRERVEYDLPEEQRGCPCCGNPMHRIGEDVSEQLHVEVKWTVRQNARAKYACRHCERHAEHTPVVLAPMPVQPIPGSHADASVIATVATAKYVDGMPLYRMQAALARWQIPVSRGTLAQWVIRPSELHYRRLYDALYRTLLSQPLIHGDETTLQVLNEPGRAAQSKSYAWVYRSAQDCAEPVVLFEYQPGRGQTHPQKFLGDYSGMLMSDGYSAWRTLKKATHFGCMAHARRLFVKADKAAQQKGDDGKPKAPNARVAKALEYFQALYRVEALAKGNLPAGQTRADYTYRLRQQHSAPVLETFKAWLDELAPKMVPQSLLGKAIAYTRNQWEYLARYATDGRAPIDNNVCERDIRPFATSRKSWLFSDTVDGAKASATIYSLVLTCRACGVEPYDYLLHVLTELPQRAPDADVTDLLPFNYARQQQVATGSG
ncbi:IS66 family transposase [Paraburkholderia dioscoreae]|uniref:Transposase n=1 Tax=Paraburkholderia dioscoreae TaxID=2604047 RepID=A0A5Q4ZGA3_9BURK|nr:IS66 family transposase [Paraburkholderia dioscoreae]VVD30245.1 transposase [Paraburkholderia dioscoreae]VVD31125.1 transposase [Paraburkholderia dioscoreae]